MPDPTVPGMITGDISPLFRPHRESSRLLEAEVLPLAETPDAILRFAEICDGLSDYWYWFTLSTLWVSYSGWSDLALWRELFRSSRRGRQLAIMKPSELRAFRALPKRVTAWRAHRDGESDWISYTLSPEIAARFARQRGVDTIQAYSLRREDCLALLLRRGENELLMLNPAKAQPLETMRVAVRPPPSGGGRDGEGRGPDAPSGGDGDVGAGPPRRVG